MPPYTLSMRRRGGKGGLDLQPGSGVRTSGIRLHRDGFRQSECVLLAHIREELLGDELDRQRLRAVVVGRGSGP